MPDALLLGLLESAESWAARAGTSLERRAEWSPLTFTSGRRPEERALLSAAAQVYDLFCASPEGCQLLLELGLDPRAGDKALPQHEELVSRLQVHRSRHAKGAL